uniref:Uncharacterized protein n=1 Tax=Arundo donax TaxID=35708 RepID=A0A0A9BAY9_ARUDO
MNMISWSCSFFLPRTSSFNSHILSSSMATLRSSMAFNSNHLASFSCFLTASNSFFVLIISSSPPCRHHSLHSSASPSLASFLEVSSSLAPSSLE